MFLTKDGKFIRTDIWREGKYLDLWSVPHFLSGIAVAFSLSMLDFAATAAFVIAFLLLVGYEMFEVIANIEETRWNRTLDVVVGMASFTPTFLLLPDIPRMWAIGAGVSVIVLDSVLSFFGWRASQKAAELEKKLRAEFERERSRFVLQREKMRARWRGRRTKWGKRMLKPAQSLREQ